MDPNWKEVFVGDLPGSVDENFIKDLFRDYGSFPSGTVTIKKHKSLDKSFAFVTFESHELAKRAITEVNYTKLDGVPIRMIWSDPNTKRLIKSGAGALFIRGLDENIEVSQLHDAFSNFGKIISCKIPLTNGKSRGYGFITFYNKEDAIRAKTDLADASINGKPVQIELYQKLTRKNPEETFTNVLIKPLPVKFFKTNEDLANLFKDFGEFVPTGNANPAIMFNDDGTSKEFGFCNFMRHEDAVRAVKTLNKKMHESGEFEFVCVRAQTKHERAAYLAKAAAEFRRHLSEETRGRNLYVKNFEPTVTDEEFEEYFKQFGEIEKCMIKRDLQEPHKSQGYGFVLFKTKEGAQAAIDKALITPLKGKIPYVGLFKTKEERELELSKHQKKSQPNIMDEIMGSMTMGIPRMTGGGIPRMTGGGKQQSCTDDTISVTSDISMQSIEIESIARSQINSSYKERQLVFCCYNPNITDDEIKQYFKQFDKVQEYMIDRENKSKFVTVINVCILYNNIQEAKNAIVKSITTKLKGNSLYISFLYEDENQTYHSGQSPKEILEIKLQQRGITGKNLMKVILLPISDEQALVLIQNQKLLESWLNEIAKLDQKALFAESFEYLKNFLLFCDDAPINGKLTIPMMALPASAPSYKDLLMIELLEHGIIGTNIKRIISSISEQQAKTLCNDQEKLIKWIEYKFKI